MVTEDKKRSLANIKMASVIFALGGLCVNATAAQAGDAMTWLCSGDVSNSKKYSRTVVVYIDIKRMRYCEDSCRTVSRLSKIEPEYLFISEHSSAYDGGEIGPSWSKEVRLSVKNKTYSLNEVISAAVFTRSQGVLKCNIVNHLPYEISGLLTHAPD